MPRSSHQLRSHAERIWRAGVAAVAPDQLVREYVVVDGDRLHIGDDEIDLQRIGRIAIVGAGKAAGAMAVALEDVLGPSLLAEKRVTGWINVPADCVVPTRCVTLHAGRPAGMNEPRPEGVEGSLRILDVVAELGPSDLCLCAISGGGSALLPAPLPGVSLEDKIRLTHALSAAGANIEQLNTVRRELSLVKGGGLARACRAGRLVSLIISDILGDPLDLIASGPTVLREPKPAAALEVFEELHLRNEPTVAAVIAFLAERAEGGASLLRFASERIGGGLRPQQTRDPVLTPIISNLIIGNNATAVDAAGIEAERLGYAHAMLCATSPEGPAEDAGYHMAETALRMRHDPGPDCLITGGEPTVKLVEESRRGRGGRNQQLVLAALTKLGTCEGIALLSGGTDGEDGPTDAAGAIVTEEVVAAARGQALDAREHLIRNDAYHFFEASGGLFKTGPTHTNVCDLRVITIGRE